MKVLILHQHFRSPYTGGAIRSYYLGQALIRKGISAVVISGHNGKKYKIENVDGIEVHYLPIAYDNSFGFYQRGLSFLTYVWKAVRLAKKIKPFDYCYAMSVPLTVGVAAKRISAALKIPYIFEVGDLWPDAPIEMGFVKNTFLKRILYSLERNIYENANSVVALSSPIKNGILKKNATKIVHVIPNMSDTEFFHPEAKDHRLENKYRVSDRFVVSYLGALGVANGLEHLVQCARSSQDAGLAIDFILCGEGADARKLRQLSAHLKLSNFHFIPLQSREGVREILNVTDACFISYKPVNILETGSPNKYFDGLAAGKLIIVNFGGWIREEIENMKSGVYVPPNAPGKFVEVIRPFLENPDLLKQYQISSRKMAETRYSRDLLSERFTEIFGQRGNSKQPLGS